MSSIKANKRGSLLENLDASGDHIGEAETSPVSPTANKAQAATTTEVENSGESESKETDVTTTSAEDVAGNA